MKAVVLEEQGVINVREVPDVKDPGPGELRIAPHTVGVCGSDFALLHARSCWQVMLLSSQ